MGVQSWGSCPAPDLLLYSYYSVYDFSWHWRSLFVDIG